MTRIKPSLFILLVALTLGLIWDLLFYGKPLGVSVSAPERESNHDLVARVRRMRGDGADYLCAHLHLDRDARWHDGRSLTAADVVFTMQRDGRLMAILSAIAGLIFSHLANRWMPIPMRSIGGQQVDRGERRSAGLRIFDGDFGLALKEGGFRSLVETITVQIGLIGAGDDQMVAGEAGPTRRRVQPVQLVEWTIPVRQPNETHFVFGQEIGTDKGLMKPVGGHRTHPSGPEVVRGTAGKRQVH